MADWWQSEDLNSSLRDSGRLALSLSQPHWLFGMTLVIYSEFLVDWAVPASNRSFHDVIGEVTLQQQTAPDHSSLTKKNYFLLTLHFSRGSWQHVGGGRFAH